MSFSRRGLAIGINCFTMLLALFLSFLACVGVGLARADSNHGMAGAPLTTGEILWIVALVMGTGETWAKDPIFYMNFNIASETDRRDVIAYLRAIKGHPECD